MYRALGLGSVEATPEPADLRGRRDEIFILPEPARRMIGLRRRVPPVGIIQANLAELACERQDTILDAQRQGLL